MTSVSPTETIASPAPIVVSGDDVVAVARARRRVELDPAALARVREARAVVERILASGQAVYGLNTGLGSLSRPRLPFDELGRFAFATVADQTGMWGRPLATDVVRAMMLARANGMAKAGVGVGRALGGGLVGGPTAGGRP